MITTEKDFFNKLQELKEYAIRKEMYQIASSINDVELRAKKQFSLNWADRIINKIIKK